MLDEVNEIIMSNLTRSSIKAKAATATASKAIKTVWKHVYPKQKKSTRMRLNSLNTAFVDLTWVTDVSCFYLRVPQITPVLCQRTKAPVLPSFPCIITTMERKSAVCSLYGGCQGNGNRFDSREHCQTLCLGQYKSRFAIFKQYNVNNVKLNSWDFDSTQGKMYNGV